MNGCTGRNDAGLVRCGRLRPTSFDEHGREDPISESSDVCGHEDPAFADFGYDNPTATTRTPRPGEGHDNETTRRPTTTRWCL